MKLYIDTTLCATALIRATPTGIHRVEYAFLRHLSNEAVSVDPEFVLTTLLLPGLLSREGTRDLIARLQNTWGLDQSADQDPVLQSVRAWINTPIQLGAKSCARFSGKSARQLLKTLWGVPIGDILTAPLKLRSNLKSSAGSRRVYFNVAHYHLHKPHLFNWLKANRIEPVFFAHDLIPLMFPEYCQPASRLRHAERLRTMSERGAMIIVNSEATAHSLQTYFVDNAMRCPPVRAVPLGISDSFFKVQARWPDHNTGYFVCVGTIEPRKNLSFLLAVWRRLVERLGGLAPRLLIIGKRGWEFENIADLLERSTVLAPFVAEISGLSDSGLAEIVANSRALLAPSMAEGFGLPLIEALACGVPVIASSISAHREVANSKATYVDYLDGLGWLTAIEEQHCRPRLSAQAQADSASRSQPLSWATRIDQTMEHIKSIPEPEIKDV